VTLAEHLASLLPNSFFHMLIHSVYFSLKNSLSAAQKSAFATGLDSLKAIEHAEAIYIGAPAAVANRPVPHIHHPLGPIFE